MCELCRLPGSYLEQLWAEAEDRQAIARRRLPSWADEPEEGNIFRGEN